MRKHLLYTKKTRDITCVRALSLFLMPLMLSPLLAWGKGTTAVPSTTMQRETITVDIVIDGDTFITHTGDKIRVWGINAPERFQYGYKVATQRLKHIINQAPSLSCLERDIDTYGRKVMQCQLENHTHGTQSTHDIGALMVKSGWAYDFRRYSKGYYNTEERIAKDAQRGIWAR